MPRHSTRVVYRMLAWRWILYLNYKRNGPRTNFELRPANSGLEIAREPVKFITKKTTVTLGHYKCTNTFWMHMSRMVVFSMFYGWFIPQERISCASDLYFLHFCSFEPRFPALLFRETGYEVVVFTSCLRQVKYFWHDSGLLRSNYLGFSNLLLASVFGLLSYAPRSRGGSETFL